MYLLPAAARTNRKLQGLGLILANPPGGGRNWGSGMFVPPPIVPTRYPRVCPAWGCGAPPVWRGPVQPMPPQPATPPPAAAIPGSPVPANFPTNQIFVNTDGTQWQYFPAQGAWVNLGIPYGSSASNPPTPPSTSTTALDTTGTPGAPVNVNVSPGSSSWQSILDWLTQATLINPIPNWIPAAGVGLLALKFMGGKH